jgi:acyl dehydratase
MTTTRRSAEHRVTAFLDGPDSKDIGNVIHSTDGAKEYGYTAALVGGVTVYGWATPSIVEALGAGWLEHGWAEIAFRHPTYPGDVLTVRVEPGEGETWSLRMTKPDGADAVVGTLGLGDAPWLGTLHDTARRVAETRPATLPRLTMDVAPVGQDLRPMAVSASAEEMREYALNKQRSTDARFTGERPLIHPGWIAARMTPLLHHSYDYGPAIHAKSHIQHLAPAESGQSVTVAGHFVETYERKGHHYGVIDGVMLAADGRPLARLRHTTIYEVAKRGAD